MSNFSNELKDYQNIPRDLIFDNSISDRARFVFCFMASKPEDWDFYMTPMAKEIGYSVETLRKYINELVERGWLVKGKQSRLEKNVFGAVSYTLKAKLPTRENTVAENFRHGEFIAQDNIDINKKEINKRKEITKVCKTAKTNWRADIEVYRQACDEALNILAEDKECEANLVRLHPNVDYYRSLLKSLEFWKTEKGWEYKKHSKSTNINMVATIKKNLEKNIVYQRKEDAPIQNERLLHIRMVDKEEGTLVDGTVFKNGYRYYYSNKEGRPCSIPVDAPERVDDRWEWSNKRGWYLPEDKETAEDMFW